MIFKLKQWSLKTRITLFTLAIFVACIWSLSFYASKLLQQDMQRLLGEQQFSAAAFVAEEINDEMNERQQYLQAIASSITPAMLRNTAELQAFLEQKIILQIMLNGGAFVIRADGTAIADVPFSSGRIGINYKDKDFTIAALAEGRTTISPPFMGRKLHAPVISITVPLKDSTGKVIGALIGVINLGKPNFLDRITDNSYGKSGGYVLLIPKHRLIITATDKSRIMQALPAPGVNPPLDRFLDGYEGSAVYVNPLGVEVLGSAKGIPVAEWLLGVTLPTAEALAPIHDMQRRVMLATLFLTLLAGGLTWWMLRRQLSPMLTAVQNMSAMSDANQHPQQLPVTSQDEIGTMIAGFNRLLESLAQRAAALKESDGRSTTVIETSPVPLALNDDHGNITFLNKAFVKTFGYTLQDLPNLAAWWPLAYPDPQYRQVVAQSWQKNLDEARKNNQPFAPMEINIQCKDGSIRTCMASASAMEGSFSKTHLVILYDISDIKKTEQALIATTLRLKEAQHIARIGNWTLNLPSGELIWSDEIFNIFEIDQTQFGATYDAFLNAIHPDDRDAVNQAYTHSLITRLPYEITHRLLMSDGRIKWVQEKCRSDFDADGKPLQSRGMVQDITESKLTELALITTRDEADRASKAKSDFLSSMSHELRTPMNAILGFAQILEMDGKLAEGHKRSVREILGAGYHLLDLINEVLDLSKIEAGHLELSMESVEVCDVVEESMKLLADIAHKHHIQFSHIGLPGAAVHADRTRLKQVLLNLISNAIKYNREGGSVRIEVQQHGAERIRILVTDTGLGIAADRLAEMFQPFNRLGAENSNILGTGIGLTITRRIIEMMGGTVEVESEVGVGSVFWIELALDFLPAHALAQQKAKPFNVSPQQTESVPHTVLYIEDNPSNLRLVEQLLRQRKHIRLLTSHSPELGIELALLHQPELILLDINMPELDGFQVLEYFKGDEKLKSIPVIAITANAMSRDIERGMAAGFNEYMTKPLDIVKFFSLLDRYLPKESEVNT